MNTTLARRMLAFGLVLPLCSTFAQDSDEDLAKQLSNPVSSLISVPFQANWDLRMGPLDKGTQFKLNFQPVVPISISKDCNIVIRTIVPYISQEDVFTRPLPSYPGLPSSILNQFPDGQRDEIDRAAEKAFNKAARKIPVDRHQDDLSDIVQSFFLSPKEPVGGAILGAGPVSSIPAPPMTCWARKNGGGSDRRRAPAERPMDLRRARQPYLELCGQ